MLQIKCVMETFQKELILAILGWNQCKQITLTPEEEHESNSVAWPLLDQDIVTDYVHFKNYQIRSSPLKSF